MTDIEEFNFELVKQFLLDRGGKVTNPELVRNFRHYLNDPVHKDHVRQRFKDFVNRLASVKEENGNVSPKEKTIQDVTVSPGTVKEKTQIINRMAESSGVPAKPALPSSGLGTITSKRREGPGARATALHWAAKYGSAEIVKLIAGSYSLNPNVKSGYTPLHLAYMFNQYHIAELLRAYGADANVRDHSGRKPSQYHKGGIPQPVKSTGLSGPRSVPQPSRSLDKDLGFMRMGSFNSRVKRTAAALTSPFGVQKLKPWGSADSVADGAPPMGPPKGTIKKKKAKKVIDFSR
ncbi:hypothetical protein V5799_026739 [Amblyomma americanum]|uniref:SOWAHA-C winged helix-turn-helix domain-containing protein n=1 Tax=Amblyomma americanum TaxID=6943 RepID=A0AAQ4DHQ5_AMBAM